MANIQERRDKSGRRICYSIRVHRGRGAEGKQLKPYTATFEVKPTWTEKSARKKAEAFAATFEKECREGVTSDSRQTFRDYCEYVLELKESRGVKHSTIVRYKELTDRIFPAMGHIKLKDLRADHLNSLYTALGKEGAEKGSDKAVCKLDLASLLKDKGLTRAGIANTSELPLGAVCAAIKGKPVGVDIAGGVANALGVKLDKAFSIQKNQRSLSAKTVVEHHRLISTVLEQASKEGLVPFNVAGKATLPKVEKKEVNYFQPEQVAAIRETLETEPIKWRTITHLLLITGARRGEILGLKWDKVDFEAEHIHICNSVLYSADIGIYESTPKTATSNRYVSLPRETMEMLREYRIWQNTERLRLGTYYENQGFVFTQDNGCPMHPDSVTDWLAKFSKRHGLPHITTHAFRHTMASMLYFNGVDSVSISKRLGHAQVSTTANIYAHVMEEADERNADILAEVFLKKA
ncbi:site-specific integrase [Acutalibacter muris]|uniref:Site-specific integrase n=1 Tax=Acutalibacter muris TaxID=1796620 RepID=A0A1Z2XR75_9FIRM|nr:site-specific integrase [Acutalibacter muris]ANU55823.1 site-specific integrase [Hungateiclostridiaceae bacterium KB18]ASB40935.1 site-specific integrase [Acutalibacter muris]QQR30215.1 site-specific integrase [Acutalibacter muris]